MVLGELEQVPVVSPVEICQEVFHESFIKAGLLASHEVFLICVQSFSPTSFLQIFIFYPLAYEYS